ncbi:MAG TPA: hypothetical protein DIW52_22105 [Pseudomonas sp.]|nr:hypothetical protein [Pseudomonas sp.]
MLAGRRFASPKRVQVTSMIDRLEGFCRSTVVQVVADLMKASAAGGDLLCNKPLARVGEKGI